MKARAFRNDYKSDKPEQRLQTGDGSTQRIRDAHDMGFMDYLPKPWEEAFFDFCREHRGLLFLSEQNKLVFWCRGARYAGETPEDRTQKLIGLLRAMVACGRSHGLLEAAALDLTGLKFKVV